MYLFTQALTQNVNSYAIVDSSILINPKKGDFVWN